MEDNNKVRFAVIGYGHIGKRHAEMVSRNPDCELAAIVDVNAEVLAGVSDPAIPRFSSLEDLLASGIRIDVANIATPNGFHASQAIQCLEHGLHVVIEKPMALSKQDAEAVIFKALQQHRNVFVVMQNRFSPPSVWMKEMIEKQRLGRIFLVQINCYWNRDARYYRPGGWHGSADLDGGTLFTQFSHFIDIMYWLFGDISHIKASFADFNHEGLTAFEDTGMVSFDFVRGGKGTLNYSTSVWGENLESSLTVIGENGTVKIGGQYMNEVTYCNVQDYKMPELAKTNPGNDYGPYKGSAANHHYVIENVVSVLKNGSSITTNALEGMKVVEMIERIYALR